MSEKVSSLLDGELAGDTLAAACRGMSAEELKTVERYQLIGSVLRREASDSAVRVLRQDLAARIAERIEQEPTWLLSSSRPRRPRAARRSGFWGGFAAAAAIAAIAVFVVAPNWLGAPESIDGPVVAVDVGAAPAKTVDMDQLNSLLIEHGEFTGSAGLNGLVAYAKFVSQGDR